MVRNVLAGSIFAIRLRLAGRGKNQCHVSAFLSAAEVLGARSNVKAAQHERSELGLDIAMRHKLMDASKNHVFGGCLAVERFSLLEVMVMVDLGDIEMLGGQLAALQEAEKLLMEVPVKTQQQVLQLAELRARIRQLKRQLKTELERVQLKLAF